MGDVIPGVPVHASVQVSYLMLLILLQNVSVGHACVRSLLLW